MTNKDKIICRVWNYWVEFYCEDCNAHVRCDASDVGKRVYCYRCHSAYRVEKYDGGGLTISKVERVR